VLGVSKPSSNPTIVGCAYDFGDFKPESADSLPMQQPPVEVQVPYMAHLLGVASLVLGDVSDPDL